MRRAVPWLGAAVAIAVLLELGTMLLVETGVLETAPPRYGGTGFWRGHHPEFGVWHEPNAEVRHRRSCFDVQYRTNSYGARDVERATASGERRVVMLGDSFLEGWGLPDSQRLSNRLERATGWPHLNFAMAHFGPYQQLIAYERLAASFDHDAVIASVVPANDFLDLDLERARRMPRYEYRYRPYLIGESPDFEHLDHREPWLRHALRRTSYAFNALLDAARALRGGDDAAERDDGAPDAGDAPGRSRSMFYDFSEPELARLAAILERLGAATAGRPTAVLLIPSQRDLMRRAVSGPDPLSERLGPVAARSGIRLVNLLSSMAEHTLDWPAYFFTCDYHWSSYGNTVAAEIVLRELAALYASDSKRASSTPRHAEAW